jgi:hypothetical protein
MLPLGKKIEEMKKREENRKSNRADEFFGWLSRSVTPPNVPQTSLIEKRSICEGRKKSIEYKKSC